MATTDRPVQERNRDPVLVREVVVEEREVSMLRLLNEVLRHRSMVAALTVAGAVIALAAVLLSDPSYRATSRFTPHSAQEGGGRLEGIASQFGVNLSTGGGGGQPILFYGELAHSGDLLQRLVESEYTFQAEGERQSGTLVDHLEPDGDTPEERLGAAIGMMRERIQTDPDGRTGIVRLDVAMPWPELAVQVNIRLLELIDEFNRQTRQTRARMEREFLEGRLEEERQRLRAAEEQLRQFLQQNRLVGGSSEAAFNQARLQRQVDLRQQVYSSLAQSYEQARLDEIRNTDAITVIDHPRGAVWAAGMGPLEAMAVGAGLGMALGLLLSFVPPFVRRQQEQDPGAFSDLQAQLRGLLPAGRRGRSG